MRSQKFEVMKSVIVGGLVLSVISAGIGVGIGYGIFSSVDNNNVHNTTTLEPTSFETTSATSKPPSKNYVAYVSDASIPDNHYIYVHELLDGQLQEPNKLYRPFYSRLPYVTFNQQESKLEVIGDLYSKTNIDYSYVDPINGEFEKVPTSLYNTARSWATVTFTIEFGSIIIGGITNSSSKLTSVKQINSKNSVVDLPELNFGRSSHATGYYNGKLFVVGGYSNSRDYPIGYVPFVEVLDLQASLESLEWISLKNLHTPVGYAGLQFNENSMFIFGNQDGYTYRQLEKYDLEAQSSEVYDYAFSENKIQVGSFITDSILSIFGGGVSKIIQETASLKMPWQFVPVDSANSTISNKTLESYVQSCQFNS